MLKDINSIKALVLIVLSEIESPTADDLISAVLATDIVDINDVTDAFLVLTEDALIQVEKGGKSCYLTEKGRVILPEASEFLLSATRNEALSKALTYYNSKLSGTEYYCTVEKADGGYMLLCTKSEKGKEVCTAKVFFEDEGALLVAKRKFEKRPESVIGAVMAAVTGDIDYLM